MNKKSSFMQTCEDLKNSPKFQAISTRSLENVGNKKPEGSLTKFKQGAEHTAKWLGARYGSKSHV